MKNAKKIKWRSDGSKVVVIQQLENQSLVEELVVVKSTGEEKPSGNAQFVLNSTLHDVEVATVKSIKENEINTRIDILNKQHENLDKSLAIKLRKAKMFDAINSVIKDHSEFDGIEQLQVFLDFISGKITHAVAINYSEFTILTIEELLISEDGYSYHKNIEGLKLLSLFGTKYESGRCFRFKEKKKGESFDFYRDQQTSKFDFNWKIHRYWDGSGQTEMAIIPCRSMDEAIKVVDQLIADNDIINEKHIALKEKYNLQNPSNDKLKAYYNKQTEYHRERINKLNNEIVELNAKIAADAEKIKALNSGT